MNEMRLSSGLTFFNKYFFPPVLILIGSSLILLLQVAALLIGSAFLFYGIFSLLWGRCLCDVVYTDGEFIVNDGLKLEKYAKEQLMAVSVLWFSKNPAVDLTFVDRVDTAKTRVVRVQLAAVFPGQVQRLREFLAAIVEENTK